jgi:hypothetical protein
MKIFSQVTQSNGLNLFEDLSIKIHIERVCTVVMDLVYGQEVFVSNSVRRLGILRSFRKFTSSNRRILRYRFSLINYDSSAGIIQPSRKNCRTDKRTRTEKYLVTIKIPHGLKKKVVNEENFVDEKRDLYSYTTATGLHH